EASQVVFIEELGTGSNALEKFVEHPVGIVRMKMGLPVLVKRLIAAANKLGQRFIDERVLPMRGSHPQIGWGFVGYLLKPCFAVAMDTQLPIPPNKTDPGHVG